MVDNIIKGLNATLELLKELLSIRKDRRNETMEAVKLILEAATETRAYLKIIEQNPERKSNEMDMHICGLWMNAGSKIYYIDQNLGDRCMIKADCWSDERLWKSEQYKDTPLKLDSIISSSKEVLRNS
ncbi:hypothetical protein [Paraglaciecola aestuariivivens]